MNINNNTEAFFEKFHSIYNDFEINITKTICDKFQLKDNNSYILLKEFDDSEEEPQPFIFNVINNAESEEGFKIENLVSKNLLNLIPENYLQYIVFNCDQFSEIYNYPTIEDINELLFEIDNDFQRKVVFNNFLKTLGYELFSLKICLKTDSHKLEDMINLQKFGVLRIFCLALIRDYELVFKDEINLFIKRNKDNYILYNLNDYELDTTSFKEHISKYWFITGLNFANGRIFDYLEQNLSANKIAEKLGNKNLRPFITESLSIKNSNKNIFSDSTKVDFIIKYFENNKLNIDERFILKIK